jgi:hypothetical protein
LAGNLIVRVYEKRRPFVPPLLREKPGLTRNAHLAEGTVPIWFMRTTPRRRSLYTLTGFTFLQLLAGGTPVAAQDNCKVVLDAMMKVFDTPTHAYVTMDVNGKSQTGESIYVGGLIYAKYGDKWSAGTTAKEMKEIEEKNRQTNKTTCTYLKDELVNGEMAAVYSVHDVSPRSTSDSKTWISKSKGLPLRADTELAGGKNHISTRYEYGNVKPPM